MIAVDTSVAVPAVSGWHESHDRCRRAAFEAWIPSHALLEAFSVLTRMPAPHRLAAGDAARVLTGFFAADRMLFASDDLERHLVETCAVDGIGGGAVYDALIGQSPRTAMPRC